MGTQVTCCKCAGRFDERDLAGEWLNRRCPLCGVRICEEDYDAVARDLIAANRGKRRVPGLSQLALSRYYTSEWFRLACASRGSEAADKGLFGCKPGYDRATGRFTLNPADGDRAPEMGLGTSAEYFAFDALRAETARKGSPLHGARLLPGLVFPWLPGQKPKQWGASVRAETDCILLADSFAVVFEVKRRNHHVHVAGNGLHVRESTDTGQFKSASEVISQVSNGAEAFLERQALYPADRVFRAIVYVDPLSFQNADASFHGDLLMSMLDTRGEAYFVPAVCDLAEGREPVAGRRAIGKLAGDLLRDFGNTAQPREGRIVNGGAIVRAGGSGTVKDDGEAAAGALGSRPADRMLQAIAQRTEDERSPLFGARLLHGLTCEVEMGKRSEKARTKAVKVHALLLTRSFAVLIDSRAWHVHVNTHAAFATVYTGDPDEGARQVRDRIRHDWDLDSIHYRNRSATLSLPKFAARRIEELDRYRSRNRVCLCTAFVNPASFTCDCDDFRSRAFIGWWRPDGGNLVGALERLAASAAPIMTQGELDAFAKRIASIR